MNRFIPKFFTIALACLLGTACTMNVTNKSPETSPSTPQGNNVLLPDGSPAESGGGGGVINGGGGKGVRCTKDGQVSLEVLDLYEARNLYGLDLIDFGTDEEAAKQKLAEIIARHFQTPGSIVAGMVNYLKRDQIQKLIDTMRFQDSGKKLKSVNDAFEPTLEKNCEPVQIAMYYDESVLLVDKELWTQLNLTNKMALLAHEIIYFLARERGATNSMSSRKLVGMMFSSKGVTPLTDGLPLDKRSSMHCSLEAKGFDQGDMYLHLPTDGKPRSIEAVFMNLGGQGAFFRTSAIFNDLSFGEILLPGFAGTRAAMLVRDTYPVRDQLQIKFQGTADGRLRAILKVLKAGENSADLEFEAACSLPDKLDQIDPKTNKGGIFKGKSQNDLLTIQPNGTLTLEETRMVGRNQVVRDDGSTAMSTVLCRVRKYAVIIQETEQSISYSVASTALVDDAKNNFDCESYIQTWNAELAKRPYSYVLEKKDFVEMIDPK